MQMSYLDALQKGLNLRAFSDNFSHAPPINVWLNSSASEIFCMLESLEPILKPDCANLIDQIARKNSPPDSSQIATIKVIFSYFGIEKSCEILTCIINEDIKDFKNLLNLYIHDEDTPKDNFFACCLNEIIKQDHSLIEKIVNNTDANKCVLLNGLLEMVDQNHLSKVFSKIISCLKDSFFQDVVELVCSISNKEIRQMFFKAWITHQKCKWTSYKELIVSMIVQLETNKATEFTVLRELLCELNQFKKSSIDNLAHYLKLSCSETQLAYILAAASNPHFLRQQELQTALAEKYSSWPINAAKLLAHAFKLKDHHLFRKYSIRSFAKQISRNHIAHFFENFLKFSDIDPIYLIYAISKRPLFSFFQFLEEKDLVARTEIFNKMGTCGPWELRQILKDLKKAKKIESIMDECTFYLPSEKQLSTCGYIFKELKDFFKSGFSSFEHIKYIQEIPPIFLAFALYDGRFQSFILNIFYSFNSKQQKFIISQLCAAKNINSLDLLISLQNSSQKIYNQIPEKVLIFYHTQKTNYLKEKIQEFQKRFENYKEEILFYRNSKVLQPPTAETFAYLNDELIALSNLLSIIQTKPYHIAFHRAVDKEEKQKLPLTPYEAEFKTHMQIAKKLLESLKAENFGAILIQLENQFNLQAVEEGLPDHFIAMLTPEIQKAFKINNNTLKKLQSVGIENETDLILLGYEPTKEDLLQGMRNYVLDCIPRLNSQTCANKCEDLWNSIYKSPFNNFFDLHMEEFIAGTTLLNASPKILSRITTHLLDQMEKLIPFENCNLNKEIIDQLRSSNAFKETMKLFMKTYRAHIIPTLGYYLQQNSLVSLWKQLGMQKYTTLTSLDDMGLLAPNTPFNMQTLVNTMFPQSAHA